MVPIKRTVFLPTVTVLKNTVRLIGTIEYATGCFVAFLGNFLSPTSSWGPPLI